MVTVYPFQETKFQNCASDACRPPFALIIIMCDSNGRLLYIRRLCSNWTTSYVRYVQYLNMKKKLSPRLISQISKFWFSIVVQMIYTTPLMTAKYVQAYVPP